MRFHTLAKHVIGAAALSTMILAGACSTTSGDNSSQNHAYLQGVGLFTRYHHDTSAAAPAPAPVSKPETASRPAPRATRNGACSPNVGPDQTVSSQAFPTGEVASSALMVYTIMPKEVRLNQPYEYQVQVCNLTSANLQNVVVSHENSSNLQIISSNPAASRGADGTPQWILGSLGPNESQIITVVGKATSMGISSNCVSASYNNSLCAKTRVVEPALALKKTATPEALLCDTINIKYTVTNTGTGACDNVVVTDKLPAGLATLDGKKAVKFNAGALAAGQSKSFAVKAKADHIGRFSSPASATSNCGADANAAAVTTIVRQPKLAIKSNCKDRIFLGRNVTFNFDVSNSGNAACDNTVISVPVPSGSTFVSATNGGQLTDNTVVWNAGTISSNGGTRHVSLTVKPNGIGTLKAQATADCVCAKQVATACKTRVEGIPAILLEVVDNTDPILVGDEVTYVITVMNQGTATGTGIRIVCDIPAEETFISASGATRGSLSGKTVTFAPLPSLAPKAKATFRIVVKAAGAGDVRFKTSLTSDQFKRPIEETESTNLYK